MNSSSLSRTTRGGAPLNVGRSESQPQGAGSAGAGPAGAAVAGGPAGGGSGALGGSVMCLGRVGWGAGSLHPEGGVVLVVDGAKKTVTRVLDQFGWETAEMGKAEGARAIEPLCILRCIPGFLILPL